MNWMPQRSPQPARAIGLVTWLLAGLLVAGCGGDDSSGTSSDELTPDPTTVGYAGEYDTAVTLVGSTCPDVTVTDHPTIVALGEEDGTITMRHADVVFSATINDTGTFVGGPQEVQMGEDTHTMAIEGSFSGNALQASIHADVTGSQTCEYDVSWEGTRS